MKCEKCGKEITEDMNFCPTCGFTLIKGKTEQFVVNSENLIGKIKQLLHEGNVNKIIVKNEKGAILLEIPITIGLIGFVIAPWLAALGAIAAIATNCTIIVEKKS